MKYNQYYVVRNGIINCDHLKMPKRAVPYFVDIMYLLNHIPNIMMVCNCVLKQRCRKSTLEELVECFNSNDRKDWKYYSKGTYTYPGAWSNRSELATVVFYKKEMRKCNKSSTK